MLPSPLVDSGLDKYIWLSLLDLKVIPLLLPFGLLLLNLLRAFIFTTGGTGTWGPLSLFRLFIFAFFFTTDTG